MIIKRAADRASFDSDKMGKADLTSGEHLFCGLNAFEPGQQHAPHVHCERDKIYVVLEGQGDLVIGDESERVGAGDMALAPSGVEHSLGNPGPDRLVVMVVMGPPPRR